MMKIINTNSKDIQNVNFIKNQNSNAYTHLYFLKIVFVLRNLFFGNFCFLFGIFDLYFESLSLFRAIPLPPHDAFFLMSHGVVKSRSKSDTSF